MHAAPTWLEVREDPAGEPDESLKRLDAGEAAAIRLGTSAHTDLLLMDDRKAVSVAERMGLRVTGTLGLLDMAAERGLVDFHDAIRRLQRTSFRRPQPLLERLLRKHQ